MKQQDIPISPHEGVQIPEQNTPDPLDDELPENYTDRPFPLRRKLRI